jgi:hypothetical protein
MSTMNPIQITNLIRVTPIERMIATSASGKVRPPGHCSFCGGSIVRAGEPRSKVKVEMRASTDHLSLWHHCSKVGGQGQWEIVGDEITLLDGTGKSRTDIVCSTCDLIMLPPNDSWAQEELF